MHVLGFGTLFRPQILSNSLLKWCNSSLQLPDIHIPVGAGRSKLRWEAQDFYTQTEPIQPSSKANMSCVFPPNTWFPEWFLLNFDPPGLWSKRCGRCLCSCLQCTLDLDKKNIKNRVKREESCWLCIHIFRCFPSSEFVFVGLFIAFIWEPKGYQLQMLEDLCFPTPHFARFATGCAGRNELGVISFWKIYQ